MANAVRAKRNPDPSKYRKIEWHEYITNPSLWGKDYVEIPGANLPTNISGGAGQPGATVTPGAPPGTPGGPSVPGTIPAGLFGVPSGGGFWTGEKPTSLLFQPFHPYQQEARFGILNQALQQMQPLDFDPIEAQARQQFKEETIPTLLERFNSSLGGERSSAFPQILGAAGKGLESDLAAQRANYGLAQNDLLQRLLGIGLSPEIESILNPGREGFLGRALGTAGDVTRSLIGAYAGKGGGTGKSGG